MLTLWLLYPNYQIRCQPRSTPLVPCDIIYLFDFISQGRSVWASFFIYSVKLHPNIRAETNVPAITSPPHLQIISVIIIAVKHITGIYFVINVFSYSLIFMWLLSTSVTWLPTFILLKVAFGTKTILSPTLIHFLFCWWAVWIIMFRSLLIWSLLEIIIQ